MVALQISCSRGPSTHLKSLVEILLTVTPAALLLAPAIHLMHQAITIGIAPVFAALTSCAACLMPPIQRPAASTNVEQLRKG